MTSSERVFNRAQADPWNDKPSLPILVAAFKANPSWEGLYLFHDGRVEEEHHYQRRLSSRQAQLNSIASDGFPVLYRRSALRVRGHLPSECVAHHWVDLGGEG